MRKVFCEISPGGWVTEHQSQSVFVAIFFFPPVQTLTKSRAQWQLHKPKVSPAGQEGTWVLNTTQCKTYGINPTDPDLLPNISVGPHAFALLQLYYGQSHASVTSIFKKFTRLFIYLFIWSHKAFGKEGQASWMDQLTSRAHKIIFQIQEHFEIEGAHRGIHPFVKQYRKISSAEQKLYTKNGTQSGPLWSCCTSHADLNQSMARAAEFRLPFIHIAWKRKLIQHLKYAVRTCCYSIWWQFKKKHPENYPYVHLRSERTSQSKLITARK